jgi:hypothetical protein
VDSVRGGNLALTCPSLNSEIPYVAPSGNSVAWCWNLLPDRSNGFNILTWTGNDVNGRAIAHGLGKAPEFIIVKSYWNSEDFCVWHSGMGSAIDVMFLNNSNSKLTSSSYFGGGAEERAPDATNFYIGSNNGVNGAPRTYVSYVWTSVPGYSAFGSYQGDGAVDGPFIYTGFRPAFLMIKAYSSTGSWKLRDTARDTYNPCLLLLGPNSPVGETSDTASAWDILSNGFKLRNGNTETNGNGWSYTYMAFAEHPFGGGNVAPSPAR